MSKLKVAFQGEPGANSDIAAREVYPDCEPLPCATFEDALAAIQTGEADLGMIPIENSIAGRVADIHHLLPHANLHIVGEHFLPIHFNLMAPKGATLQDDQVGRKPHPRARPVPPLHPQARLQGGDRRRHRGRGAAYLGDRTTSRAPRLRRSSRRKIYGLEVLAENVEDEAHNTTRFVILSREKKLAPRGNGLVVTTFVFRCATCRPRSTRRSAASPPTA